MTQPDPQPDSAPAHAARSSLLFIHAAWFLFTFFAYALAIRATAALRVADDQATPLWIPLGLMTGIYVATRPLLWPAITAAALLAQLLIWNYTTAHFPVSLTLGLLNDLSAALAALLVVRLVGPRPDFTLKTLAALSLGALIGVLVLAAPISFVLSKAGLVGAFWPIFFQNCVNGPLSTLIIAPPVATLIAFWKRIRRTNSRRVLEGAALLILVALTGYLAFWVNDALSYREAFMLLPVPLLIWAVLRFDVALAAAAVLLVEVIAFLASRNGAGPLRGAAPEIRTFILQINFLCVSVAVVFTASVITDRRLAQTRLRERLRFEEFANAISALLVRVRHENLGDVLPVALGKVAELFRCNRVVFGAADVRTGELFARAFYRTSDPPFPQRFVISDYYPHMWNELRQGRTVNICDTSRLPPEAAGDQNRYRAVDIRSQLAAPFLFDGALRFVLAASNVGATCQWSPEDDVQIRVLAEAFASAVMRCDAEADVQRNEKLFRAFVENAPVPIMISPWVDGSALYFNPAFTRLFGYTRDDIKSPDDWWPLAYPDLAFRAQRRAQWEEHKRAAQLGAFMDGSEAQMLGKDRAPRYTQVRLSEIDGYRLIFFSDLTARRHAEQRAEQHLARVAALASELTRAEERQRREIAAVLHDDVGQSLFAATTQLLALKTQQPDAADRVDKILLLLDLVARHTRTLTYDLCPPVLYQMGLKMALTRVCDQFSQQYGILCTVTGDAQGPADLNLRGLAYHAARELLANVAKHSHAKHVQVTLKDINGDVLIHVCDDGVGFDATAVRTPTKGSEKAGFGHFHLQERVDLVGGSLTIHSSPGAGCRVDLRLPSRPPATELPS